MDSKFNQFLLSAAVTLSSLQSVRCDDGQDSDDKHKDGGSFWVGFFGGILITVIITLIVRCCRRRQMKKKGWKLCKHGECSRCDLENPLLAQTPQQPIFFPQMMMPSPQVPVMPSQQSVAQPTLYPPTVYIAQTQPATRVN